MTEIFSMIQTLPKTNNTNIYRPFRIYHGIANTSFASVLNSMCETEWEKTERKLEK